MPPRADAGTRAPLLIATRSSGKVRELRALLAAAGHDAIDLCAAGIEEDAAEDDLESGTTFEENALAKARHFFARSGMPTIADDSGLEISALGGAPGIRSKRWSERADLRGRTLDDANNALLLERLTGTNDRHARYVCAAAYCDGTRALVGRGEARGQITTAPRGRGGFGYDPYFLSDELGRTFAEVTLEAKSRVSHRARAVAEVLRMLASRR